MKFLIFSSFLNFLASVFCGLFVLLNNPRKKTNQTFFYFSMSVCFWAFFQFLWEIHPEISSKTVLYTRLSNIASIFIPTTFFHFTAHLINEYKRYSRYINIFYTVSIVILTTGFSELFIPRIEPFLFYPHYPVAGPTFTLNFLKYLIIPLCAIIIIYKKMLLLQNLERQQLKYLLIGITIAYISGTLNFLICYKIPIPPYANIFVAFYTIFISYAALKYKLMDIQIIIKRSLIYTTLITVIALLYFLSIYLTEQLLQMTFGYRSLLTSFITASTIAVAFIPFKNLIERSIFKESVGRLADQNDLLRQEITRAEKTKAVALIASGLAHEIRNPMTAIQTFTEHLPQRKNDPEFIDHYTRIVSQEAKRVNDLVQELLDFAKPSEPKFETVEINHLITDTLHLLNGQISKNKITLENKLWPSSLYMQADPSQLKQALLNIILNAIDVMPQGGTLTVETNTVIPATTSCHCEARRAEAIFITISDTGPGIDPKDLPHIFEPFFTKKKGGTGLGLAITQRIIEKHSGRITIRSNCNQGTAFTIQL